jgi:hypothetical protein
MEDFDQLVQCQFGLLTREQAIELFGRGGFERRVRRGSLIRMRSGLYRVAGAPITDEQDLFGWTLLYNGHASTRAAAAIIGFDRYRLPQSEIVVASNVGSRSRKDSSVRIHRSTCLPPSHLEVVRGIPSTSAARTAFDLSAILGLVSYRKLIDDAARRKLVTYPDLATCRDELRRRGRRRSTVVDQFLEERGFGFDPRDSDPERDLGDWLFDAGLDPVPQFPVVLGADDKRYLDYAFPEFKVGAEYLGIDPHSQPVRVMDDSLRTTELQLAGWLVVLVTKATGRAQAVAQVREALQQRGWQPDAPTDADFP